MNRRFATLATIVLLAAGANSASAEWAVRGEVEHFRWRESVTPAVTETGPRFGIGLKWTQDKDAGWLARYRGRVYGGRVDYRGTELFTGAPAEGKTDYSGMTHELHAIHRAFGTGGVSREVIAGLGVDYWDRELSTIQTESFSIVFLRLGLDLNTRARRGWFGGGGVKYPLYIREDARLTDIGFDQNPRLRPGEGLSLYGELGFRITEAWSLAGYYDGFRLRRSGSVRVTANQSFPGATFSVLQPKSSLDTFGLSLRYDY